MVLTLVSDTSIVARFSADQQGSAAYCFHAQQMQNEAIYRADFIDGAKDVWGWRWGIGSNQRARNYHSKKIFSVLRGTHRLMNLNTA